MPIDFKCPHCGHSTLVADQYAGQSGPCAKCGQTIVVPAIAGAAPTIPPPPRSSGGGIAVVVAIVAVVFLCGLITLPALLLPAVQAAREAARRTQCANNLKQIGLAMHNYHDINGSFPPAYVADDNGKPMHSWRVLILPYMEQAELHSQYDMNESWGSATNRQLLTQMPQAYQCPSAAGTPGQNTSYVVVIGPGAIFNADQPCRIADIVDGASNTILVVEAAHANIPWTEPRDLDLATMSMTINSGANSVHSDHPGGASVLFADGSVRYLRSSLAPEELRALLTKDGGEVTSGNF